jgi:hypothetical protein
MAKVTIRIDYDGGGHAEFCEQSLAGLSIADLNGQAIVLVQVAFEKAIRAAGMTFQPAPPPDDEPAQSVDTEQSRNGKANTTAKAAGKTGE